MAEFDGRSVSAMENSLRNISSLTNALIPSLETVAGVFTGATIAQSIANLADYEKEFKKLSYRMGEANKRSKEYVKNVYAIQKATGAASKEIAQLQVQLVKARIKGGEALKFLTTQAVFFQEATGVSGDTVGRLTGELSRMGKLSTKSISGMLTNIAKTQRAFGMTEEEVTQLTEGIIETTRILRGMGKSSTFVEGFGKGLTKLAAGFTSVGLSADKAAGLVERLLDPGQIEDNAYLYSKLGISMEDAISGNIDPADMQNKLKALGQEMKSIGGPAAAAMARQMGMSLGELRQMGDMTDVVGESGKNLKGMATEGRTWFESMEKGLKSIGGGLMGNFAELLSNPKGLGIVIGAVLGGSLIYAAIKFGRKMKSIATDFTTTLQSGIGGALGMKSSKLATIREQRSSAGENAGMSSDTGDKPIIKRMFGTKKFYQMVGNMEEQNNKTIKHRLDLLLSERTVTEQKHKMHKEELKNNLDILQARIKILQTKETEGIITGAELKELRMARKTSAQTASQLKTGKTPFSGQSANIENKIERQMSLLSPKQKAEFAKGLVEQQQTFLKEKTVAQEKMKNAQLELNLINERLKDSKNLNYSELKLLKEEKERNEIIFKEQHEVSKIAKQNAEKMNASISKTGTANPAGQSPLIASIRRLADRTVEGIKGKIPTLKDIKNVGLNGLKGTGNALKSLGKFALVGSLPMIILSKILPKLQPLIDIMLSGFDSFFDAMAKVAFTLLKTLGPILMRAFAKIIPMLMRLTNFLVWALGGILNALTVGIFNKEIKKFTEALHFKDEDMKAIEEGMLKSADDLSKIEFNTNPENASDGGTVLTATGSGFKVDTGSGVGAATTKVDIEKMTLEELKKLNSNIKDIRDYSKEELEARIKELQIGEAAKQKKALEDLRSPLGTL